MALKNILAQYRIVQNATYIDVSRPFCDRKQCNTLMSSGKDELCDFLIAKPISLTYDGRLNVDD